MKKSECKRIWKRGCSCIRRPLIDLRILRQDYILKVPRTFMVFFKMKEILGTYFRQKYKIISS